MLSCAVTMFATLLIAATALAAGKDSSKDGASAGAKPAGATATALAKYDSLLIPLWADETKREATRAKLRALPLGDVREFATVMKPRLAIFDDARVAVMSSFQTLSRRTDLDPVTAAAILATIEASPLPAKNFESEPLRAAQESDVTLWLRAKAGLLTPLQIQIELTEIANTKISSVVRTARLAALIDATESSQYQPTFKQLQTLLKNEDYEIRMLSIDWFRVAPLRDLKERNHFLKLAVQSKPNGVRERAFRTIASWSAKDIADVSKISPILPNDCQKESSPKVRQSCVDARAKASAP